MTVAAIALLCVSVEEPLVKPLEMFCLFRVMQVHQTSQKQLEGSHAM